MRKYSEFVKEYIEVNFMNGYLSEQEANKALEHIESIADEMMLFFDNFNYFGIEITLEHELSVLDIKISEVLKK